MRGSANLWRAGSADRARLGNARGRHMGVPPVPHSRPFGRAGGDKARRGAVTRHRRFPRPIFRITRLGEQSWRLFLTPYGACGNQFSRFSPV